jgi:hypothetical protein
VPVRDSLARDSASSLNGPSSPRFVTPPAP